MSFNNEPPPLHPLGSQIPEKIRNIQPEIHICVNGRNPNIDTSMKNGIKALGKIDKFSSLYDVVTGGYSSVSEIVKTMVEKSLDVDSHSLAQCAYNIQQKNLTQHGFSLYVRIKYEQYTDGWLSDGYETKYTKWAQWLHDGFDLGGHFESADDITKPIIRKAIIWQLQQFVKGNK